MATKLKIPSVAKAKKYFQDKTGEPVNIVDGKASEDYAERHIPGAVNLPKAQWQLPATTLLPIPTQTHPA